MRCVHQRRKLRARHPNTGDVDFGFTQCPARGSNCSVICASWTPNRFISHPDQECWAASSHKDFLSFPATYPYTPSLTCIFTVREARGPVSGSST